MSKVAVIGCGVIGQGWAVVFARSGFEVCLFDAQAGAAEVALERIDGVVRDLLSIEDSDREAVRARISIAVDVEEAVAGAIYVQESITEEAGAKRDVFIQLDALAAPDTILASSASAIPPDQFLADVEGRRRCLIAHPFNPPYLITVVEVLPNSWTDAAVLESCLEMMRRCGQAPILVKRPIEGFVVNRLQVALVNEAMNLVARGVASPADIDTGVREGLGRRWAIFGPFETMNSNAPNGFREYTAKFGSSYQGLGQDLKIHEPWDPKALEAVAQYLESSGRSNHDVEKYRDEMIVKISRLIDSAESQ